MEPIWRGPSALGTVRITAHLTLALRVLGTRPQVHADRVQTARPCKSMQDAAGALPSRIKKWQHRNWEDPLQHAFESQAPESRKADALEKWN